MLILFDVDMSCEDVAENMAQFFSFDLNSQVTYDQAT